MIGRIRARLGGSDRAVGEDPRLGALKLEAIDYAFENLGCETVADLGGVWAVDGGYALHAIDRQAAARAVICDDDFSEPLIERAASDPRLELVEGNFGRPETVAAVGPVDAILLFDVLLHQVSPDWDEILRMYADVARTMVLAGPWWNGPESVRLVDLGRERYLRAVPKEPIYEQIWEKLDQHNPQRGRPWRDCHDIWQWGITEADLTSTLAQFGFELQHRRAQGSWMGLEDFEDVAFVFGRGNER